jgi:superfamily II DNA or RNA helicase
MSRLEDIKPGGRIRGIIPSSVVEIVSVEWIGEQAIIVVYRPADGRVAETTIYRDDEHQLSVESAGRNWTFDADGEALRLVTEASRIRLAHFFDPYLAIHTSQVDPLPHQISAVYGEMLTRQPLRFLLADDPGAGKTIMAGLLIKELIARSDLERCLVVAPGSLVEQWQDELGEKFGLEFDILSKDMIETSRSGNPFDDCNHMIARLDVLARNEDLQNKLLASREWDLIIADEAHRMSASYFGNEVTYTKRYQLGQKLGQVCRHFLLMSATPHNGKEQDFQLFMALLDGDRFEGRFRDGVHVADVEDMMRRLTKEELLRFDGRPLFPERRAYTIKYELSALEAQLYSSVTEYVRDEMNRVQRFAEEDGRRRNNVGFALQILQRRLASSPAAIYQSLMRRRERLETELGEARLSAKGARAAQSAYQISADILSELDEYGQDEIDDMEDRISAGATSAETIEQLELEVETLKRLENMALNVLHSGQDTKWSQLDKILDDKLMTDGDGNRRKLIIFTEPKDTLEYLKNKVTARLGRPDAVDVIYGGVTREERRKVVERFMQDKDLLVLIANDAAGEGVNLQRGHLMVNYDLPWNPNKIEQRFGRIHRIGQTEVCHLWNLVAKDTREGEVYARLLEKLEAAREALGGRVYDVLGELFEDRPLKDLLFEAIQYNDDADVKARLFRAVDGAVDQRHLLELLQKRQLTNDTMPAAQVHELRIAMEKAEAQRLQPHHIQSFFVEAFKKLGGQIKPREEGRWEITHVPLIIRERDRQIGRGVPLQKKYERICFDKGKINQQPVASFVYPGHPLLEAVISIVLEQNSHLLKQGAVLVDDTDDSVHIEALFLLEHSVIDGKTGPNGGGNVVSQKLQFATIDEHGNVQNAGIAPHLNLRAATEDEIQTAYAELNAEWLRSGLEKRVEQFATINLGKTHVDEVKARRLPEIDKVEQEVRARLKKEINYWDNRSAQLKQDEKAGRKVRSNWQQASRRA